MIIEIQNQIQNLIDNRHELFKEFEDNRSDILSEIHHGAERAYIAKDYNNYYNDNSSVLPLLYSILDNNNHTFHVSFSKLSGNKQHNLNYAWTWDRGYKMKRFYLSSSARKDTAAVCIPDRQDEGSLFFDWTNQDEIIAWDEDPSSENNVYMVVDVWDSATPPTPDQINSYYHHWKQFLGSNSPVIERFRSDIVDGEIDINDVPPTIL